MKKIILILAILFGCGMLSAQAKKKVIISPFPGTTSDPTGIISGSSPILSGEYDADTLTITISNYWGNAEIYILSTLGHHEMDSAEETINSEYQLDFPLEGYVEDATYQIFITLENGESYMGEIEL